MAASSVALRDPLNRFLVFDKVSEHFTGVGGRNVGATLHTPPFPQTVNDRKTLPFSHLDDCDGAITSVKRFLAPKPKRILSCQQKALKSGGQWYIIAGLVG